MPDYTEHAALVLPQSFRNLFLFTKPHKNSWDDSEVTHATFSLLAAIKRAGTNEQVLISAKQALAIIGDIYDEELSEQLQKVDHSLGTSMGGFGALFAALLGDNEIMVEEKVDFERLPFDQQIKLRPIYNAANALASLGLLGKKNNHSLTLAAACIILEAFLVFFEHTLGSKKSYKLLEHWLNERGCSITLWNTFSHYSQLRNFSVESFYKFSSVESVTAFALWVIAHHHARGIALKRKAREACLVLLADDFRTESIAAL